jgi:LysW-gamma-L-lysine carboxypeptidase
MNRDQAIDLLQGLVKTYSPSQHERAAVEYLVARMGALGFRAFVDDAGNAVGTVGSGPRQVVLLGHIDTFHGQIDVRIQDGQLYGRGSVDAKGCLAAFVSACANVGAREGMALVVIGAVEEECATSKGARFAITQYQPDFCVIGEPSGWDRVTLGYKGRVLVDYSLSRAMTHTAAQTRAVTEEAVAFWQRVSDFAADFNRDKPRLFDQLDPSLRSINSSDDGLTDRVDMRIGFRVPIGMHIDELEQQVAQLGNGASLAFSSEEPPFRADKNNALVRALLASIRAAGGTPAFTVKTGTADMNIAGPAWNCPIVAYGPGDSALDHTPDEHLDLDEYMRSIQVLESVLKAL